jgi:hypothetical protein
MSIFKIRKVMASQFEPGKLLYIPWDYVFDSRAAAEEYMEDFLYPEHYDIVRYNPKRQEYKVVVEHKKAA